MKSFFVGLTGLVERNEKFLVLKRSADKDLAPNRLGTCNWKIRGRGKSKRWNSKGDSRGNKDQSSSRNACRYLVLLRGGKEFPMVFIAFWCKHVKGEVKLGWEHSEYKWIKLSEAIGDPTLEHFHQCFEHIRKLKHHLPKDFVSRANVRGGI